MTPGEIWIKSLQSNVLFLTSKVCLLSTHKAQTVQKYENVHATFSLSITISLWSFRFHFPNAPKLKNKLIYGIFLFHDSLFFRYSAAAAKSLQSCLTLSNPIDGSPPGSPIPGILQARTLEWVAISFSNAWKWKVKVKSLSRVQLFTTPWTAAYQAPPSMGFSRQEYWSGLPFPSPGDLPDSGMKPMSLVSPALAGGFFTTAPPERPCWSCTVQLC